MNQNPQQIYARGSTRRSAQHRVLRNTYGLLALSMLPTVVGAWLGVQTDFSFFRNSPLIGFIGFMVVTFGFFYALDKTKNTGWGVLLLLGFTFFMGLMLSRLMGHTLAGYSNGAALIMMAFGGTASVFFVMASLATFSKRDFSGLGKWLFAGAVVLLLASMANVFLKIPALYLAVSVIAIAIFSAYIIYDVQRIINGGEKNYISATLGLYLDVYNIFVNLLSLLGIFGGNRN